MVNVSNKKVALVTGSAKRLGKFMCEALAQAGYALALHCHTSTEELATFAADLRQQGIECSEHQADQSNVDDIKRLADEIGERWGQLDLLVNSAAIFYPVKFKDIDSKEFDRFMHSNVRGPMLLSQSLLPLLKQSAHAHIVNISDIYAKMPLSNHMLYSMSKASVSMLTRQLAVELAPDAIAVNAIAPGAVLFAKNMDQASKQKILQRIPLPNDNAISDISNALLMLVNSTFITGQTITIDGGRSCFQ